MDQESVTSDFDPTTSGMGSTHNIDNASQNLPDLRTDARQYNNSPAARSEGFNINTSALGRAFPNFSGSASQDDSDDSSSV